MSFAVGVLGLVFYPSGGCCDEQPCARDFRVSIDPSFGYYDHFTWPEHAQHVKQAGLSTVKIVVVKPSVTFEKQKQIIAAFHKSEIQCFLKIFPSTAPDLHDAYPEWRQRMLGGGSQHDWRSYCCPNNEKFVAKYCSRLEQTLRNCPYDGVQLAESWFEVWGGPYPDNPSREHYACLCANCRCKFKKLTGVDPKGLFESNSPFYFLKDKNKGLYQEWIKSRVDTIIDFDQQIVGIIRNTRPGIPVSVTYLSDCLHHLDGSREFQAQDLERIVQEVQPEEILIQDAWQEWCRADLPPSFVEQYAEEYIPRIRKLNAKIRIYSHADIGSSKASKRSRKWIERFKSASVESGFDGVGLYEFSVSKLAVGP